VEKQDNCSILLPPYLAWHLNNIQHLDLWKILGKSGGKLIITSQKFSTRRSCFSPSGWATSRQLFVQYYHKWGDRPVIHISTAPTMNT